MACCAWRPEAPATRKASSAARRDARENRARLPLIRQRENIDLIVPPCRRDAGLRDDAARQESLARRHRDVLFAVHRVRDRAVVDRTAERRLPQNLPARGVERAELAV